jgi:hypothetical protein
MMKNKNTTPDIRAARLFLLLAFITGNAWSVEMTKTEANINKARLEFAKETIRLYGEKIPPQRQNSILEQKITIGMSPYEAKLAGGAFYYKVEADPKIFTGNADPLVVIDKQSIAPDESKIWMTFETETQFPGEGKQKFTVYFHHGKAQSIEKSSQTK